MFAKIKKILNLGNRPKPDINLSGELYEQLKPFRLPFVLVQLFLLFGTLGYLILEDYDLMQAFFKPLTLSQIQDLVRLTKISLERLLFYSPCF